MTKPPKTMEEIKQEWINEAFELEKAKAYKCCESCGNNFSNANTYFHYGFEAGFDCRDKLGDEELKNAKLALQVAREVMLTHDEKAIYDCQLEIQKQNEALKVAVEALEKLKPALNIAFEDCNDLYYKNVESDLDDALAEIQKLRGDI